MTRRNPESIHKDYDKELDFSCQKRYGKIREIKLPRKKSDILTEMKRRHNKYGRTEL